MRKVIIPGVEGEVDFELKMPEIIKVEREVGPLYEMAPAGETPRLRINEMKVLRSLAWHGCKSGVKTTDIDNLTMSEFVASFTSPVVAELIGDVAAKPANAGGK